jgi:20S proteasome subunit beta 2
MNDLTYVNAVSEGGFNYDNCLRNKALTDSKPQNQPKFTKTGTTIVGCVFKDGAVIAADTRCTAGSMVGSQRVEKLHDLAPNIWTAGAGTAADCQHVSGK